MTTIAKFIISFCLINLFNLLIAFFAYTYLKFDLINSFISLVLLEIVFLLYQKETESAFNHGK
jgi:hypothetical protein